MREGHESSNRSKHNKIVLTADFLRLRAMTGHQNRGTYRLSIVPVALALLLVGCKKEPPVTQAAATNLYRPSPTDPTPMGIAYLCDGRKEVKVVYAKGRASVTFEGKTWRLEYQAGDGSLRYTNTSIEWQGRDDLVSLRQLGDNRALAFNCRPAHQI
jgi:hypothetical protein